MAAPYWIKYLINKTFSQRFFWARVTRYPIIGKMIDHALFDGDDIFYLPTDKTIPVNESVEAPEGMMAPSAIVEHFINQASHHWIMDFCICRDSTRCKDYPVELGCIFLGEAVKEINPRFGRMVSAEETIAHARKCRDAGLVHLIGRNKLDSVWLNAGPAERLMTICNCCPCCCLWGLVTDLTPKIGNKITSMPGVEVTVSEDCTGCGICAEGICFAEAIQVTNGRAEISLECRGCGRCVEICPEEAIQLTFNGESDFDTIQKRLDELVDL